MKPQVLPHIVILGGYGAVGKHVSAQLSKLYPGAVVIAGRNGQKAATLSERLPGTTSLAIDAHDPKSYRQIFAEERKVKVVLSCVELPADSTLAEDVLAHGIDFLELTATFDAHKKLFSLQEIAQKHSSTAIVGVGLMPGLSNIIATDVARQFDSIDRIEINIMLGLGDNHGPDALAWTLRNISSTFPILKNGHRVEVAGFSEPHDITLLDEKKKRRFYRFNFSDQHMLGQTLQAKHISSRLAFDSRFITASVGWLRTLGILSLIKDRHAPIAHTFMHKLSLGSDQWALQIDIHGSKNKKASVRKLLARGRKESLATAIIATYIAKHLYEDRAKPGIDPIEQIVDATAVYNYCRKQGIDFISG